MPRFKDITGEEFGYLTVVSRSDTGGSRVMWECACKCGGKIKTRSDHLRSGHTVSCGCVSALRLSEHRNKHGKSGSRAYSIWQGIKDRCLNEKNSSYYLYGGRGITICKEWACSFESFYADMGDPPDGKSIDRIDSNGGYSKKNCRWANDFEQSRNKRTNINIEWKGESRILEDWALHLNMNTSTLYARVVVYGWDIERAFTRPLKKGRDKTYEARA